MTDFTLRNEPQESDIQNVEQLIGGTHFFREKEIKIGSSLVLERLQKGEESGYFFVFLECGGKLSGYTCYGPIPGTESSFDLYWIAVEKKQQNAGFGTVLIEETEREIRKMGGTHIYIETSSTQLYLPTRLFYEKKGYQKECELCGYYKAGDDLVVYSKKFSR
ncbi:MAG: GNAT family N-acetyltransferase [Lentisphaeria bacterium]